jgi:hypothetical protein
MPLDLPGLAPPGLGADSIVPQFTPGEDIAHENPDFAHPVLMIIRNCSRIRRTCTRSGLAEKRFQQGRDLGGQGSGVVVDSRCEVRRPR